jgi:hypothetical protein
MDGLRNRGDNQAKQHSKQCQCHCLKDSKLTLFCLFDLKLKLKWIKNGKALSQTKVTLDLGLKNPID